MSSSQADISRLLAALQGQLVAPHPEQQLPPPDMRGMPMGMPWKRNGSFERGMHMPLPPVAPSDTATTVSSGDNDDGEKKLPKLWQVPAGVGSDLTKPVTLGAVLPMWPTMDETQKINILLGITHIGQSKMDPAKAEAATIARLAKTDITNDWVRTLGNIIGDVGITGQINGLEDLDESVRGEIEPSVAQIAETIERQNLLLTTKSLGYVDADVAEIMAPASVRNVYGERPSMDEIEKAVEQAAKVKISSRRQTPSRRQSASNPSSRRQSTIDAENSASSSRLGSPDPTNADMASFSDLFDDGSEEQKGAANDGLDGYAYATTLKVKESHRADHAGRMARLLAAANDSATPALHGPNDAQRGRSAAPVTRGGRSVAGASVAAGVAAGAGAVVRRGSQPNVRTPDKIGMMAPRRRAALPANTALPVSGLGNALSRKRGTDQTGGPSGGGSYRPTKKIQMVNFEESATTIQARELSLKEQRDKAAEEREAKRQKRQAEIDERKRLKEEARQKKLADAESSGPRTRGRRRSYRATSDDGYDENENENENDSDYHEDAFDAKPGEKSDSRRNSPPSEAAFDRNADTPLSTFISSLPSDYLEFSGNDPQVSAVYANTNALTDIDRLRMYCFFHGRPMPPGTPADLEIILNEQEIDDPANPGSICKEIMVFQAFPSKGDWKKLRRFRRS
ncbi:hypothetical protein GGI12_003359 [Dipsacomyces acuminosporus]|nr:hypothetical protein GGI12_003359 [Dipsacomyces acuminosporus]